MNPLQLTLPAARQLHLAAQGVLSARRRRAEKADVLAVIHQLEALQIDTIHVVARSPYLVLFSRLGAYEPCWLEELLAEGALFEYWAHEACFLPIADYGLYRHRMIDPQSMGWKYSHSWMQQHQKSITQLLQHIRAHGPVRSADFERKDGAKGGGWWSWKPEKRSLEVLFTAGELMVSRRHNFQRVYELRERIVPDWDDARDLKPDSECLERLWAKAVKALGCARAHWIGDYFRTGKVESEALERLCQRGELFRAQVEGWSDPVFIHREHRALAERAAAGELKASLTTLLSPFDPVVWDRRRAAELFDFDYRLECYTPAPKRQYGYFVLPILHRGRLVGRLDAKAHRQAGRFEIKSLHLEPNTRFSQRLVDELAAALRRTAAWHGTPELTFDAVHTPDLKAALMSALS